MITYLGTLEWVDTCFSTKLAWKELPTPGSPQGRQGDIAAYRRRLCSYYAYSPIARSRF
jgi:hypothetical protein